MKKRNKYLLGFFAASAVAVPPLVYEGYRIYLEKCPKERIENEQLEKDYADAVMLYEEFLKTPRTQITQDQEQRLSKSWYFFEEIWRMSVPRATFIYEGLYIPDTKTKRALYGMLVKEYFLGMKMMNDNNDNY